MPKKSESSKGLPKRKLIDEMQWLASEAGMPFNREEEHLELVVGSVERAVDFSSQKTLEAINELKDAVEERTAKLEAQLGSILYALWTICGISGLIALKLLFA